MKVFIIIFFFYDPINLKISFVCFILFKHVILQTCWNVYSQAIIHTTFPMNAIKIGTLDAIVSFQKKMY